MTLETWNYSKIPLFLQIFVHSVSVSVFGQMFFRPDIQFWPKLKNILSVIHRRYAQAHLQIKVVALHTQTFWKLTCFKSE